MKTLLFFLATLTITTAYAQDPYFDCQLDETCIINEKADLTIKTIPIEDHEGNIIGERLTLASNIADTLHPKAEYCFQGDPKRVCDILGLMSYDEGHFSIDKFSCRIVEGKISVNYIVNYDFGTYIEVVQHELSECQYLFLCWQSQVK